MAVLTLGSALCHASYLSCNRTSATGLCEKLQLLVVSLSEVSSERNVSRNCALAHPTKTLTYLFQQDQARPSRWKPLDFIPLYIAAALHLRSSTIASVIGPTCGTNSTMKTLQTSRSKTNISTSSSLWGCPKRINTLGKRTTNLLQLRRTHHLQNPPRA